MEKVQADRVAFAGSYTSMFSAEHLAAELLRSGRLKDHARVLDLLKSEQMDMNIFRGIIHRHGWLRNGMSLLGATVWGRSDE